MGIFHVSITKVGDKIKTVQFLRSTTGRSLAEVTKGVGDGSPVLVIDSSKWEPDEGLDEACENRGQDLKDAIAHLTSLGNAVQLYYQPTADFDMEEVSVEQAENLLESELQYLRQQGYWGKDWGDEEGSES